MTPRQLPMRCGLSAIIIVAACAGASKPLGPNDGQLTADRKSKFVDADAAKVLEQRCKAGGSAIGCFTLGLMYLQGRGVAQDAWRATGFMENACVGGVAAACAVMGEAYFKGTGARADKKSGLALLVKACDAGHPPACALIGNIYRYDADAPRDNARAAVALAKACDTGYQKACAELKDTQASVSVKDDVAGRLRLLKTSAPEWRVEVAVFGERCDAGDAKSCFLSGKIATRNQSGAATKLDADRFAKACKGGFAEGCTWLGELMGVGHGVAKSMEGAAKHFQKGCDAGDARGCTLAGTAAFDGAGVNKNAVHGVGLAERACAGGNAIGCRIAGVFYDQSVGASDPVLAAKFYEKACKLGEIFGCARLGVMSAMGRGVAKDRARALELTRRACDQFYVDACYVFIDQSSGPREP